MQPKSAIYPWPFATCFKDKHGKWIVGLQRTIQSCRRNNENYQEYVRLIQNFQNCDFIPLLDPLDLPNDAQTPVWVKISFPPLHKIFICPVNHLEKDLSEIWSCEGYDCVDRRFPRVEPEENPVLKFYKPQF